MKRFLGKPLTRWTRYVPVVMGVALIGCGGEIPSSQSDPGIGPRFQPAEQPAAARSALTVDPRSVRLRCNAGFPCDIQLVVTSSSPVSLQYSVEGDFTVNFGGSNCGGVLAGSCVIQVAVISTELPGRRSATLTLEDLTNGTIKTVRLSARVS